jgi:DNA-directed RNA polymerase subunit alpha
MSKRLGQFQRPKHLKKEESSATPTYAKYTAEPETGFGHTVGNPCAASS